MALFTKITICCCDSTPNIQGETFVRIVHNLIAPPGVRFQSISAASTRIRSR